LSNKSRIEINNLKEELRIERIRIHERTRHEHEINEIARKLSQQMKGGKPEDVSIIYHFSDTNVFVVDIFRL
jgi:hypothetical protein